MQKSNAPTKLTVVFASGTGAGPVNTVPLTPGATPGTASYQTGFTSVNMEPIASGGIPPFGADFNGVFKDETIARIWQQSGYTYSFDSAFASNANIGGYPAGSALLMGSGKGLWLNQTDNNTASPDASGSTGWLGIPAAGSYTLSTTGGTKTPDPSLLGVTTILVTGTLTSNATVVLPLSAGSRWIIANNTTGSFTLTVKGATGAGVAITQASALMVFTDGTAYFAASANISGSYLPIDGTAVAATKLANARSFTVAGPVTAPGVDFDGTGNVTLNTAIADGALSIAKTSGLQSAIDGKVNKVGDTMTGPLTVIGKIAGAYQIWGTGRILAVAGATSPYPTVPATTLDMTSSNVGSLNAYDYNAGVYLPMNYAAASHTFSGPVSVSSLAASGAITSATATVSGTVSVASLAASGAITSATVHASSTIMAAGGFQIG
jgi:hypothetical protein